MELEEATLTTMETLKTLADAQAIKGFELIHTPEGTVLDALVRGERKRLCVARGSVRYFKTVDTAVETLLRLGATRAMIEFRE
ncbi:TPA: hypothetical protein QDA71_005512 [Burkholderia vietnamiensis]|uniref:hypothetical protein n=1 Tax=Burkholderia vietnamiensis TaxID=60552 RepID=UPI001588CD6E|nr:hypothetical protein [Burkholderia vietnamiensis]HDR8948446.1 hypothetical protein [Burkholderia vietnamiensis]HDR9210689.1 hypothetical protein [Burkholderia vietnamiensis]